MLDESPAIPRLGIKKFFWWSEALHGAANMGNVTNFPEPVGMASSFNPQLLYKVFDIASTETSISSVTLVGDAVRRPMVRILT